MATGYAEPDESNQGERPLLGWSSSSSSLGHESAAVVACNSEKTAAVRQANPGGEVQAGSRDSEAGSQRSWELISRKKSASGDEAGAFAFPFA